MRVGVAATQLGQTFFYVKNTADFASLLNMMKRYSPYTTLVEDIESTSSGSDRNEEVNKLLNTLDGVQTKGTPMNIIFTTNNPDKITHALRRPGRIDLIVQFNHPNKTTVGKIYKLYFEGMSGFDSINLDRIVSQTPECQGAVIAEICKRGVKLALNNGNVITEELIIASINSMKFQIEFMKEKVTETTNPIMAAHKQLVKEVMDQTEEVIKKELAQRFD